jgi:hypothetical protein
MFNLEDMRGICFAILYGVVPVSLCMMKKKEEEEKKGSHIQNCISGLGSKLGACILVLTSTPWLSV